MLLSHYDSLWNHFTAYEKLIDQISDLNNVELEKDIHQTYFAAKQLLDTLSMNREVLKNWDRNSGVSIELCLMGDRFATQMQSFKDKYQNLIPQLQLDENT